MIRGELKPTLRLAGPVVLAELGWMGMGVVDTIMVGPLGPAAIGAAGVGNSMHLGFAIFGMGLLLGLDTLVSQAYGARRPGAVPGVARSRCAARPPHHLAADARARRGLVRRAGARLPPGHAATPPGLFRDSHPDDAVAAALRGVSTVSPEHPSRRARHVCARHRQPDQRSGQLDTHLRKARHASLGRGGLGLGDIRRARLHVRPAGGDRVVDVGRRGGSTRSAAAHAHVNPAAGRVGSSRRRPPSPPRSASSRLATALAGRLEPVATASHQIALNIAAVAFMIPLGLASAGAVRVGNAVGARNRRGAAAAGWTVIAMSVRSCSFRGPSSSRCRGP